MLVPFLIALSIQAAAAPEPGEPAAAARDAVAPASEAAIDAFVAALPEPEETTGDNRAHELQAEQLREKNPGREFALEPILEAHRRCDRLAVNDIAMRSVRESARRMGDERLRLLTQFYGSDDFVRFSTLIEREAKGTPLGPPETAELEAMFSRYPLQEFAKVSEQLAREMFTDKTVLDRFGKCLTDRNAALKAAGLNY
jgi:hypothetical protein